MPNHLINENSPYLLQHAKNPVDWYPWGKEALTKARTENMPIFLSIGYAACHWVRWLAGVHRLSSELTLVHATTALIPVLSASPTR